MKKITQILILLLTLNVLFSFSQERKVTGSIKNNKNTKLTYAKTKELFLEVLDSLKKENSNVLGTFTINKRPIDIEENNGKDTVSVQEDKIYSDFLRRKKVWLVNNVEIEIKEGFITDILVTLIEKSDGDIENPEKRYFTNRYASSLVFFNRYKKDPLRERGGNKKAIIQLFDVLNYQHKMGRNFIPNDRIISISRKEGVKNLTLDNNLDSFLDFRIYSDFLGLINETPNGIINFETSSKIILNPIKSSSVHLFKSVTPFLKYSRFDNDKRKAFLSPMDSISIFRKLDLEQKAFLSVGASFDFLEWKFAKEFPFSINIPASFRMNITEVGYENDESDDNNSIVNTLVYATGVNADFKRIHNFGLKLGLIYEWYDQKGNSDGIKRINTFKTIGMTSEIYYYNPNNRNSAFFLRFRTNRLFSDDGLENYAALQFGYKSSLNFSVKNKK